jgi:hypothetical protein
VERVVLGFIIIGKCVGQGGRNERFKKEKLEK